MYVIISYFSENPLININNYLERFYGQTAYKYDITLNNIVTDSVIRMDDSTVYYISIIDKTHLDIMTKTIEANKATINTKKLVIDVKSSYMLDGVIECLKKEKIQCKFVSKDLPETISEVDVVGVSAITSSYDIFIPLETQNSLNINNDTNIIDPVILSSILNNEAFKVYNEKVIKLLNLVMNSDTDNKLIIFRKDTNQTLVNIVKYAIKTNGNKNIYVAHGYEEYAKLLRHQFALIYIYNELDKFDLWAVPGFGPNSKVFVMVYNKNDPSKNLLNTYKVVKEEQNYILGDIPFKYSFKRK